MALFSHFRLIFGGFPSESGLTFGKSAPAAGNFAFGDADHNFAFCRHSPASISCCFHVNFVLLSVKSTSFRRKKRAVGAQSARGEVPSVKAPGPARFYVGAARVSSLTLIAGVRMV